MKSRKQSRYVINDKSEYLRNLKMNKYLLCTDWLATRFGSFVIEDDHPFVSSD